MAKTTERGNFCGDTWRKRADISWCNNTDQFHREVGILEGGLLQTDDMDHTVTGYPEPTWSEASRLRGTNVWFPLKPQSFQKPFIVLVAAIFNVLSVIYSI